MDPVLLARIQFAMTVGFHFLFPPITIGLAWLLVIVEWKAWRKGEDAWRRAGLFFGKVLALTFAVGVATGIVMEFQFGTNWASYSRFVGDIFGAPLAAEGIFAFFLESAFLGLYLFGRRRVSKGVHWFSILMVAVGSTLSAFWIIAANSWQQTPAGYTINEIAGRAELVSFSEAIFNPSTLHRFLHTILACLVTGAFFMAGFSSILLLKGRGVEVARRTLTLSLVFGLVASVFLVHPSGHGHAKQVARTQPAKLAAIEGHYQPTEGGAPMVLFALPSPEPPELLASIEVPRLLSILAFGSADHRVQALSEFPPDEVPRGAELWLAFVSFHNMVILGIAFILVLLVALFFRLRKTLFEKRWLLRVLAWSIPLPLAACQLGWITAEVGRQPWVVYGLLKTEDAASKVVSAGEILFSIILFGLIYAGLGALWVFLLGKKLEAGPGEPAGTVEVA